MPAPAHSASEAPRFSATFQAFEVDSAPASVAIADLDGDGRLDVVTANAASASISVLRGSATARLSPAMRIQVPTSPGPLAIGELTGGALDVVVGHSFSDTVTVLAGDGAGGFSIAAYLRPSEGCDDLALADVNGDSLLDVITAHRGGGLEVFLNLGHASFAPRSVLGTPGAIAVVAADLDGDGDVDLALARATTDSVMIWTGLGDGGFVPRSLHGVGGRPLALAAADVSGGGLPDLVVTRAGEALVTLTAELNFEALPAVACGPDPRDLVVGFVDADDRLDAVVVNGVANTISILPGIPGGSFGPRTGLSSARSPIAAALGDLDGDGSPEVVTAAQGADVVCVYAGAVGGPRAGRDFVVGSTPRDVVIADFNGDARLDLAVATSGEHAVSIARGIPGGAFAAPAFFPVERLPQAIAAADLDRDGDLDVVSLSASLSSASVLLGDGSATFGTFTRYFTGPIPRAIAIGDVNGDSLPDVMAANSSSNVVAILMGNGDGTLGDISTVTTGPGPRGVALADLDGDGDLDLAVSNYGASTFGSTISILLGHGDGTFDPHHDLESGLAPRGIAVGDLNGDGHLDLAVAGSVSSDVSVYFGHGDGSFEPRASIVIPEGPAAVAISDLDHDGQADLAVACGAANLVAVLFGDGAGGFPRAQFFGAGANPSDVKAADLDGDGFPELVVANTDGSDVSVLDNVGDDSTPVLVSLIAALVAADRVRLRWSVSEFVLEARAERREAGAAWRALGPARAEGDHAFSYDDATVVAGARYAYRLAFETREGAGVSAEHWVAVPEAGTLGLTVRPHPARGRWRLALDLPAAGPARLDVLDAAGRRMAALRIASDGAGRRWLGADVLPDLAPGVYLFRLRQGGRERTTRVCVVR